MKREVFLKILNKLKSRKDLRRKLKIFVIVGLFGFFVITTFAVWIGFKAYDYVASNTNNLGQSPLVKTHTQNIKSELTALSTNQVLSCWRHAQSLVAIKVWLERSAIDNLIDLKNACLENRSSYIQNLNVSEKQNNN